MRDFDNYLSARAKERSDLNVLTAAGAMRDAAMFSAQAREEKRKQQELADQLGFKRELVQQGLDFNGQPQYDRNEAANIAANAKMDAMAAQLGFKNRQMDEGNALKRELAGDRNALTSRGLDIRQQSADQQAQANAERMRHNQVVEQINNEMKDGKLNDMEYRQKLVDAQMQHMQAQERIAQGNLDERIRSNHADEILGKQKFEYGQSQDAIANEFKRQGIENAQDRTNIYRGYVEENIGRTLPKAPVPQVSPATPNWQKAAPRAKALLNTDPESMSGLPFMSAPLAPPQAQAQASADQSAVRVQAKQKLLSKGYSESEAEEYLASKGM